MRLTQQILILGSLTFVLGFAGGLPRASAEETAPAKATVTEKKDVAATAEKPAAKAEKSEHCARCHDKHAATCAKHCKDCAKESCAKCEHCKGQADCSKCAKCHEKEGEKDGKKTAKKAPRTKLPAAA